jgi:hypothetical protein
MPKLKAQDSVSEQVKQPAARGKSRRAASRSVPLRAGASVRFDVNETLLRHMATGGGAAYALRNSADSDLIGSIAELFGARSDIRRLDKAQQVARAILRVNDFGEMMAFRDIVAQQELRRIITYSKQKDHTAHTVYLYILGIWFFDHVTELRSAITRRSGCANDTSTCDWFLFHWLYASLLHDIGYAFYDLSDDTAEDRALIDRVFTWEWLESSIGSSAGVDRKLPEKTLAKLRGVHEKWWKTYGNKMPRPTAEYRDGACVAVLERLAAAPWLGDLYDEWKGLDIFDILMIGPQADLREYAMTIAQEGYQKGGNGCVDHAVASGLLLFQYSSYWYWLMNALGPETVEFRHATEGFDYNLDVIRSIADACRSVAYHNVQLSVNGGAKILQSVTLKSQPILYLAILCDELQVWDRYPAGDALLRKFQQAAAASLEGGDIELKCNGTDKRIAHFSIQHALQKGFVKDLQTTLGVRLADYKQVAVIEELIR